MGYYKNIEIEAMTEEPDRLLPDPTGHVLSPRRMTKRRHHRETYRAPNHWVIKSSDFWMMLALVPMSFALGVLVTILVVIS